ncbi:MAG: hypothetical protein H6510_17695 [Acidobacteria bacterium]|nr:hypothetical protein [Acidobacteriota bacterium]MCB9399650.1 hypothetical protein [Acidobacteriota bacterium]
MKRRNFLQWSSLAPLTPLYARSKAFINPDQALNDPRISVAYWNNPTHLANPGRALRAPDANPQKQEMHLGSEEAPFVSDLVPAHEISPDDQFNNRTLRFSVLGFLPGLETWQKSAAAFSLSLYQPDSNAQNSNFVIWRYQPGQNLPNQAVGLNVSLNGPDLTFYTQFSPNERATPLKFSLNREDPSLKLRAGVYLVALADRSNGLPDWRAYQMRSANEANQGTRKYPYRLEGDQLVQADFPYMAFIFSSL